MGYVGVSLDSSSPSRCMRVFIVVVNCETISYTADISIPISDETDVVTAHTPFGTRSGSAITNLDRITLLTFNISNTAK